MTKNTAVIGLQWGDEGKGKLVDILADEHDLIVRYGGGANAGHTVVIDEQKYAFNLLPSGVLHPQKKCVLGNGMVIHPRKLLDEIEKLPDQHAQIFVSNRAHVVLEKYIEEDIANEEKDKIGTTKRGIGPAYTKKIARKGVRFCDWIEPGYNADDWGMLTCDDFKKYISPFVCDTRVLLQSALDKGEQILFEGAQATLLDIDHGTYPFVTSSNTSIGGVYTGTGIRPRELKVIGVAKAYTTRVGEGPFPTEQINDVGKHLQEKGIEVGTTTGRKRRCGWFDAVIAKYSAQVNGIDEIALTKLDVLTGLDEINVCTGYNKMVNDVKIEVNTLPASINEFKNCIPKYITFKGWSEDITKVQIFEQLPKEAQNYVCVLEQIIGAPITYVGVGAKRNQIIKRPQDSNILYFLR